jgi:hypothetical protein
MIATDHGGGRIGRNRSKMTEIERLEAEIAVLEAENVVLLRESNAALHRMSAHNHNTLQRKLQLAQLRGDRGEIAEVHRQLHERREFQASINRLRADLRREHPEVEPTLQ